ncbi:MAG: glycoside hydrolase family 38 C-terminal domain-containing protein [Lachnospiraceae bacterium]
MEFAEERIKEQLRQLEDLCYHDYTLITDWNIAALNDDTELDEGFHKPAAVWYNSRVILPCIKKEQSVEIYMETDGPSNWDEENPQFECYINQKLCQGIDRNHRSVLLDGENQREGKIELSLRGYFSNIEIKKNFQAYLRILEKDIEQYYYDILVPYQIMILLEKDDTSYQILLTTVNNSLNYLDLRKPYSECFFKSLKSAKKCIQKELYERHGGAYSEEVFCIGHTHIDIAWLWPIGVTKRKAVRSFSTVLKLMEQYPEYIFMSSQPQLYKYVKQEEPQLYEKIKRMIAEGRWEAEGGMFVEADCNLTGGEALIRQFLTGTLFFDKEFGKDNEILWLPDVFGYSAALPQIMKECGIRYFMTTKISWNDTNKMPYDTFYWRGIDGTQILTHFIPTRDYSSMSRKGITNKEFTTAFSTNYNGDIVPSQVKGGWQRYQQKDLNRQILLSFGYGDGGGGPTKKMLETQRRLEKALPGCPKTRIAKARDFFKKLEASAAGKAPVWSGELYLEFHRATYTSMGKNKRLNRCSEFSLQNIEMIAIYAQRYPKELLSRAWEVVLRNQFHDILPGSSIEEVYDDSWKEYEAMLQEISMESKNTMREVEKIYRISEGSLILYNFNGVKSKGLAELEPRKWERLNNTLKQIEHQVSSDNKVLIRAVGIPPKGILNVVEAGIQKELPKMQQFNITCVENKYYRLIFNEKGQIESFYDKRVSREVLKTGEAGNVLMTYEDKPHDYDNWNIYHYYKEKSWEITDIYERAIVEKGPLRYALRFCYRYLDSDIVETLYFYPDSSRIDLHFYIDWRESQIFLKLLFPLQLNTNEATFDIQYGNVTRSMTRNTSWDCARFEVCYQKWMDISEEGYGVSFINDCKYGVSIEDNTVGLSLIKSGLYPNPHADKCVHTFAFSVYAHLKGWREAGTAEEAYCFNNPIYADVCSQKGSKSAKECMPIIETEAPNVIVEAIKQAESGDGIIVRLYEYHNCYSEISCRLCGDIIGVEECDMLERKKGKLFLDNNIVSMTLKPYEIKTIRLIRRG